MAVHFWGPQLPPIILCIYLHFQMLCSHNCYRIKQTSPVPFVVSFSVLLPILLGLTSWLLRSFLLVTSLSHMHLWKLGRGCNKARQIIYTHMEPLLMPRNQFALRRAERSYTVRSKYPKYLEGEAKNYDILFGGRMFK